MYWVAVFLRSMVLCFTAWRKEWRIVWCPSISAVSWDSRPLQITSNIWKHENVQTVECFHRIVLILYHWGSFADNGNHSSILSRKEKIKRFCHKEFDAYQSLEGLGDQTRGRTSRNGFLHHTAGPAASGTATSVPFRKPGTQEVGTSTAGFATSAPTRSHEAIVFWNIPPQLWFTIRRLPALLASRLSAARWVGTSDDHASSAASEFRSPGDGCNGEAYQVAPRMVVTRESSHCGLRRVGGHRRRSEQKRSWPAAVSTANALATVPAIARK